MAPPTFSDLLKVASDVLGDDYTSKYLVKAKSAPSSMPVSFTIEDEIKGGKGVEGTLTCKYKEPYSGVTFDKIKLKGSKVNYEASKSIEGVKLKAKGDPTDLNSTSGSAEFKTKSYALTAAADKKCASASATFSPIAFGVIGCDATYTLSGGAIAYNAGLSYTFKSLFGGIIYSSKKIATLALCWSPVPELSVAATVDSDKKEPTVGIKYGLTPTITVGAKTTKESLALVYVNKLGKDATVVVGATSKYADIQAKPTFGATLTIG